jgi:hypothetical protein
MDLQVDISTLFFAVFASFIASWLFYIFINQRKKAIKQKISELELEEQFLERISKGNVGLLRTAFLFLFFSLGISFASISVLILVQIIPMPELAIFTIKIVSVGLILGASIMCFSFCGSLLKLKNLKEAKSKIQFKKNKLEGKLD